MVDAGRLNYSSHDFLSTFGLPVIKEPWKVPAMMEHHMEKRMEHYMKLRLCRGS